MKWTCFIILSLGLVTGCKDSREVRQYTDVRTPIESKKKKPAGPSSLNVPPGTLPAVAADLAWDLPEGWTEQAGSGMRMATLYAGEGDGKIETSLIAFEDRGGVQTNLERWLGQLNITLAGDRLGKFVEALPVLESDHEFAGQFADLTGFTEAGAQSMLAGIIKLPDGRTLYIKATGEHAALIAARPAFLSFCQSIRDSDA